MDALLVSAAVVALAEIGDKTQLLALALAARFRRRWAVIGGILVATLANHALAGILGRLVGDLMSPEVMRWVVGLSFLPMAAWALVPDRAPQPGTARGRLGPFLATSVAFFLVEIGDKTQIATVALAARYPSLVAVILGTTLGMMLANVPAVLCGELATGRLPMRAIRLAAAALFAGLGTATLLGLGS